MHDAKQLHAIANAEHGQIPCQRGIEQSALGDAAILLQHRARGRVATIPCWRQVEAPSRDEQAVQSSDIVPRQIGIVGQNDGDAASAPDRIGIIAPRHIRPLAHLLRVPGNVRRDADQRQVVRHHSTIPGLPSIAGRPIEHVTMLQLTCDDGASLRWSWVGPQNTGRNFATLQVTRQAPRICWSNCERTIPAPSSRHGRRSSG